MSVLLDVLGSVITGGVLILMMMTFQLQMRETTDRILYTTSMIDHMDEAATKINHIFAMAGIGIPVDSMIVEAKQRSVKFKTFWDCDSDTLSNRRHVVEIKVEDALNSGSKTLVITQDDQPLSDLGYILYIEDMILKYYNKLDALTTNAKEVMAAEVFLTFRRDSPWSPERPLRSNIQLKCYLMNAYLQAGGG